MKRIIIHWTAGTGSPNVVDLQHYHYLIDSKGNIHIGNFKPEDNENCSDGKYAAHTGGGNTGSIGVALCGMLGGVNETKHPLTRIQCERMFQLVAQLVKKYKINISSDTVMTHYEFGLKNPKTTSKGKIDIIYLPPFPEISKDKIGDFIREKVKWYRGKCNQ